MRIAMMYHNVSPNADESDKDTLRMADAVSEALGKLGHKPVHIPFTFNLLAMSGILRKCKPDMVFNLADPPVGLGRMIAVAPLLLESMGIPYTGCGANSILTTSDKLLAKKVMDRHFIETPLWLESEGLTEDTFAEDDYIIKSAWEHASVGLGSGSVSSCEHHIELKQKIHAMSAMTGSKCFAEVYIEGREFNVAMLSGSDGKPRILPIQEMVFENWDENVPKIVGYDAKWKDDSQESRRTVRKYGTIADGSDITNSLTETASKCWKAFGLNGYARIDFRVDRYGNPYVLEVNANPGISPDSGFVAALREAGISYEEAIDSIIGNPIIPFMTEHEKGKV